jgi:restriction endonuclease Mrr
MSIARFDQFIEPLLRLLAEHSGSPGDDGIDGVISFDRLGLYQVYVQARGYAADRRIQKEAIHGFIGAIHLKGANKGIFAFRLIWKRSVA